jgi:hypothetical protein
MDLLVIYKTIYFMGVYYAQYFALQQISSAVNKP